MTDRDLAAAVAVMGALPMPTGNGSPVKVIRTSPLHTAIADAIVATIPGARPEATRVTIEYAYAQLDWPARDTWSGSPDGLAHRIALALEKTTPAVAEAEVTAAVTTARTVIPTAPDTGLTVYRAVHDSITAGLFTTEATARQCCETLLSAEHPGATVLLYDWIGDEDDPDEPRELTVQINGGDEQPTGYIVQALRVEAQYDPDAEW